MTYKLYVAYLFLLFSSFSVIGMYEEEKEHDDAGWRLLAKYHEALVGRDDALEKYTSIAIQYRNKKEKIKIYNNLYSGRDITNINGPALQYRQILNHNISVIDTNLITFGQQNKKAKNKLIKKYNRWFKLYTKLDKSDQHVSLADCLSTYCIINNITTKQMGHLLRLSSELNVYNLCNAIRIGGFDIYSNNYKCSKIIEMAKKIVPAIGSAIAHKTELENGALTGNSKWDLYIYEDQVKKFVRGDTSSLGINSLILFFDSCNHANTIVDTHAVLKKVRQLKGWKKDSKNKHNSAPNEDRYNKP